MSSRSSYFSSSESDSSGTYGSASTDPYSSSSRAETTDSAYSSDDDSASHESTSSLHVTSCLATDAMVESVPKHLLVMRHGERTDDLFPGWIERSTRSGRYVPYDINMPRDLRFLDRPMRNFHMDTPLTMLGSLLAQFVGRGMAGVRKAPDVVYASPALRCVQTAHNAALFAPQKPLIRVEPGLFENNDLYPEGRPKLMSVKELHKAGFNVDLDYEPVFAVDDVFAHHCESNDRYNRRLQKTLQMVAERKEFLDAPKDLSVLVCAHASTVDMAIGHFVYNRRKTLQRDLVGIADRVPYTSFAFFTHHDDAWKLREEAIPFVTYDRFSSCFDRYFMEQQSDAVKRLLRCEHCECKKHESNHPAKRSRFEQDDDIIILSDGSFSGDEIEPRCDLEVIPSVVEREKQKGSPPAKLIRLEKDDDIIILSDGSFSGDDIDEGKTVWPSGAPAESHCDLGITTQVGFLSIHKSIAEYKKRYHQEFEKFDDEIWRYFVMQIQDVHILDWKRVAFNMIREEVQHYYPNADITIVGSTLNGCGNNSSDLDMCLCITDEIDGFCYNDRNIAINVLRDIEARLIDNWPSFLLNIELIPATCCCDPPVLPNLQYIEEERFSGEQPLSNLTIGHSLAAWPKKGTNKQTVGELLIGFFEYYANHFDFHNRGISIYEGNVFDRTELDRQTLRYKIFVEEPFDGNNTARCVTTNENYEKIIGAFRTTSAWFLSSDEVSPSVARLRILNS
ncbi:hypothetical protein QR680_004974 [Steinernema hermaphroditum]|uniref:PAP-associated domain-containing protein n=1 Tax=Steinernema hermaphroditum TaxID=289476 RepID=A0AA39HRH3_9BILA|nr:hypothetical protein QR680_004974 [Steinernema hermaphroditum]